MCNMDWVVDITKQLNNLAGFYAITAVVGSSHLFQFTCAHTYIACTYAHVRNSFIFVSIGRANVCVHACAHTCQLVQVHGGIALRPLLRAGMWLCRLHIYVWSASVVMLLKHAWKSLVHSLLSWEKPHGCIIFVCTRSAQNSLHIGC